MARGLGLGGVGVDWVRMGGCWEVGGGVWCVMDGWGWMVWVFGSGEWYWVAFCGGGR